MSETKGQSIAPNVGLKPSDHSAHLRAAIYTNIAMAQGIAYLDFGFIEPTMLASIANGYLVNPVAYKGRRIEMIRTKVPSILMICVLPILLVAGCAATPLSTTETPGQHFDRVMKEFAANCAKAKLKPNDRSCDRLMLKPANPLATEEGRFAHSIRIPNPLPEDSGYQPGMTSEQYFDHLCKTEAGEFIYKTVENVEGLYMMRPRKEATDYELEHLYALEDPYGQVVGEGDLPQDTYVQPAMGKYEFLEMPFNVPLKTKGAIEQFKRYYRYEHAHPTRKYQTAINGQAVFVPYIVAEAIALRLKSRYGFTWRGIARPHDRELGIAGGETLVLDLETQEVLAIRRGFIQSVGMKNLTGIWWLTGQACQAHGAKREHLFLKEILKPVKEK